MSLVDEVAFRSDEDDACSSWNVQQSPVKAVLSHLLDLLQARTTVGVVGTGADP